MQHRPRCPPESFLCHTQTAALAAGFDSQEWYKQLFEYGLNGDDSTSGNGSDPDEELVPRLVGQLVLPLAAHSLQHAWNPHSRRSTAAAKAMLEDLLIYVPPEEPKLQVRSTPAMLACQPVQLLHDDIHICAGLFVAVHSLAVWQGNRLMYGL